MKNDHRVISFLKSQQFSLLLLTVISVIVFALLSKGVYVKAQNIRNILNAMVIVSFLTIGEGMLIIYGNIDLSCGYSGTLCALLMAYTVTNMGFPWYISLVLALAAGVGIGLLNATLIVKLNFQPFIATLAMASITQGLSYVVGNASSVKLTDPVLTFFGTYRFANGLIPFSVIISLAFLLIYGIILSKSRFGRKIYMCGSNREAARLAGLNPKKMCYILFANMGFLSALCGIMMASRMKSATVNGIASNQFSGITAAILGGISFGGGSGGLMGAFFGLLLLNCFNNGMSVIGVDPYWQTVASGTLLFIALMLDFANQKRRERSLKI